jgi:hypothetical protein
MRTTKTTNMMILAAALILSVNVSTAFGRGLEAPKPTCGISTVSYRFVGTPGTQFQYAGDAYRVPSTGTIELIAEKKISDYHVGDRKLPLNVWPQDEFGTRTVPLPTQIASK